MNPIRDYISEVIVNVTKRTLWGFVKQFFRGVMLTW